MFSTYTRLQNNVQKSICVLIVAVLVQGAYLTLVLLVWFSALSNIIQSIIIHLSFPLLICAARTAACSSHGSAAGKRFRGVQGSPGAPKLLGPKPEQGEHAIFNRGTVSTCLPFLLPI